MTGSDQQYYLNSIRSSLSLQMQQRSRWESSLDFLRLRYFDHRMYGTDEEKTEVHYVWAYYNTLIPTLYSKNPYIFCKARKPRSLPFAESMEQVCNYYKDELKMKMAIQSAISDTVPYGIGWTEVGYTPPSYSYTPSHKPKPSFMKQIKNEINKLAGTDGAEERVEGQLLPDVRGGKIFLKWQPAYRVLLAPGYHSVQEMPYLIVIEDIAPEEYSSNQRFNPDVVRKAKPSRFLANRSGKVLSPQPAISRFSLPRTEGDSKFFRVFHIHDRRNMRKIGFSEGVSEELYDEGWGCSFDEFSLVPLIFNDTPPSEEDSNSYPMDDITPLKPQLLEKSLLRTSMIKARRRMAPLIIVDKDLYSEDEIALLQSSEEAVIVPVRGGARGFFSTNPVKLPDEIFRIDGTIDKDLDLVSGFSQLLLSGGSVPGIDTATEASVSTQGSTIRGARKVDIIESHIVEVARRIAAYALEYHDRTDVSEVIGKPVSADMWPDTSNLSDRDKNKLIRQELSFRIEAKSTQPDQVRLIEQNLAIRNTNMMAAAFPDVIDRSKLLRFHMKKMGDKEFEYVLKPETESSQREADQENQLLAQGIFQLAHQGDRHDVHIPTHGQAALLMQAQGIDTSAVDKHIMMHNQLSQIEQPQAGKRPQKGDSLSPAQAAVPELQRTGGEDNADQLGMSAGNSVSMGPENSMSV